MRLASIAAFVALVLAASASAATPHSTLPVNARLTSAMVELTGRANATVRCYRVDDGAEGGTWTDTAEVQLEPAVCKATKTWSWWRSPRAVAVFAHEGGHLVRGMSEADASCYAGRNLYLAARLVGFGPHKAKLVVGQQRSGNLTYCGDDLS